MLSRTENCLLIPYAMRCDRYIISSLQPDLLSLHLHSSDPVPSPSCYYAIRLRRGFFRFRVSMLRELLNLSDFSLHGISVFFRSSRCHHYSIRYASLYDLMDSSSRTVHTRLRGNRKASVDNLLLTSLFLSH
jgi:hypothetical protein